MFFSKSGTYKPCGIFTNGHLSLLIITMIIVMISLRKTINKNVQSIIKKCTIFVWIFEIIIIVFKISENGLLNVNRYVPLYFCSLLLYAGLLSSFGRGKIKRTGDVFLSTGALIGGFTYLIYPSTSLPEYPIFHLVTFHSFIYHGILIYLGLLINFTNYIQLKKEDIIYYSVFVGVFCIAACTVNSIFDSNLMFISKNFPGTIIELMYNITGKYFTLFTIVCQMTIPFYVMIGIKKLINYLEKMKKRNIIQSKEHAVIE